MPEDHNLTWESAEFAFMYHSGKYDILFVSNGQAFKLILLLFDSLVLYTYETIPFNVSAPPVELCSQLYILPLDT